MFFFFFFLSKTVMIEASLLFMIFCVCVYMCVYVLLFIQRRWWCNFLSLFSLLLLKHYIRPEILYNAKDLINFLFYWCTDAKWRHAMRGNEFVSKIYIYIWFLWKNHSVEALAFGRLNIFEQTSDEAHEFKAAWKIFCHHNAKPYVCTYTYIQKSIINTSDDRINVHIMSTFIYNFHQWI